MQILTAAEMAAADRRSTEFGVSVRELMEKAGTAVARFVLRHYCAADKVTVLCGKGNNGGDGAVAALALAREERAVKLVLLGSVSETKGEAAEAFAAARAHTAIHFIEAHSTEEVALALDGADLVMDAVVGTGFKPPLRGLAADVRDLLQKSSTPVVAVDLPSGWDADATTQHADGGDGSDAAKQPIRADAVVTFVAPKLAHIFGHLTPGKVFGPVVVAPIGTPAEAVTSQTQLRWAGTAKHIAQKPRNINSNKGKFGHVLIVGGALGKAGAPSMASLAAMRAGAGLTTAAVPAEVLPTVAVVAPELMLRPLDGSAKEGLSLGTIEGDELGKFIKGISVVGIGPGLGQAGSTPDFVRAFVQRVSLPMVIDADALNAIAGHTDLLKKASASKDKNSKARTVVLTPHPGEMARLLGCTVKDVEADRINIARKFATEHGVTLVLKGWRTLIAHPDGTIGVNTTGNPSMSKGGSGDILTGIVAAMLAQYPEDVAHAVEAAVFLHGLAADFAVLGQDEHTVFATDTVAHLASAFRDRVTDDDGFTWICAGATNGKATK